MAKSKKGSVSSEKGIQIPGFNYDVRSTFINVEQQNTKYSKQAKGILEKFTLRQGDNNRPGDVGLRFFKSKTYPTHSDMAHALDVYPQPIVSLPSKGEMCLVLPLGIQYGLEELSQ